MKSIFCSMIALLLCSSTTFAQDSDAKNEECEFLRSGLSRYQGMIDNCKEKEKTYSNEDEERVKKFGVEGCESSKKDRWASMLKEIKEAMTEEQCAL